MNFVFRSLLLLTGLLLGTLPATAQTVPDSLWDAGLFTAEPAAIQKAAAATSFPAGSEAVILYRHGRFKFGADGSLVATYQLVYRIENDEGLRSWASAKESWTPWHQDRPEIKARVINPDGSTFNFDPKTLVESKPGADGNNLYSDQKTVEAPYPQVRIGSIIEEEVIMRTREILKGGGIQRSWNFASRTPNWINKLDIEVPAGVTLNTGFSGDQNLIEKVVKVQTKTGWSFANFKQFPGPEPEKSLPRHLRTGCSLDFSTSPDWASLAKLYAQSVESFLTTNTVPVPENTVVKGDLIKTSANLMQWINRKIRYVGLEFGVNAIIPYPSKDILARGYGDCKDKATLLASFLRQAGYKAHLCLIWNGSDQDFSPTVPGMDYFNHAIVYVEGAQPLWLDPTSDFTRDEKLPYWDQDRLTLPAYPGSTGLVKTPMYPGEYQTTTQTRTWKLNDTGAAEVSEVMEYNGGFDLFYRGRYAYADPDKLKEQMESYAKSEFKSSKLVDYKISDSRDLTKPLTVTVNIKDTDRGFTSDVNAKVTLSPSDVLDWVPSQLTDAKAPERKLPFHNNLPFILIQKNRIVLPGGFGYRAVPEAEDVQLGQIKFSRKSALVDKVLEITWRLEVTSADLTPAQFEETRKALKAYMDKLANLEVNCDHEAEALFQQGKQKAAFEKFRAMVAAEPAKPIHEVRLSKALLKAGFGNQAALSAQRAVSLDPKDPELWANLAWVRQYDDLGRRFGPGYDRAGAIEAFRKALEANPDIWYIRANFATLLMADANGINYTNRKDSQEALDHLLKVKDKMVENGYGHEIEELQWNLLNFAEVEKNLNTIDKAETKASYTVAVAAVLNGPEAALGKLDPQATKEKRQETLVAASDLLIAIRRYSEASALLRQAAIGSPQAENLDWRADLAGESTPLQVQNQVPTSPKLLLKEYYLRLLASDGKNFESLRPLVTPEFFAAQDGTDPKKGFAQTYMKMVKEARNSGLTLNILGDYTLGHGTLFERGSPATGYMIGLQNSLVENLLPPIAFVRMENGKPLIAATLAKLDLFGKEVWTAARSGKWQAGAQWLDWLTQLMTDASYDMIKILQDSWPAKTAHTAEMTETAGLRLMTSLASTPADLDPMVKKVTADPNAPIQDWQALLLGALEAGDGKRASLALKNFSRLAPDDKRYWLYQMRTAAVNQNLASFIKLAREELTVRPSNDELKRLLLDAAVSSIDTKTVAELLAPGDITLDAHAYNSLAWMELFLPKVSDKALEYSRRAVRMSESKNWAILHTMAVLYAQVGRYEEAWQLFQKCLGLSPDLNPGEADYLILGRIAEGYGFVDTAREAYGHIKSEDNDPLSSWNLAKKYLANLKPKINSLQ